MEIELIEEKYNRNGKLMNETEVGKRNSKSSNRQDKDDSKIWR